MSKFNTDLKGAGRQTDTLGKKMASVLNPTTLMGGFAGGIIGSQVLGFLNDTAKAASDLEQSQAKVNVVFGEAADEVTKWAENSAEGFLMSKNAALEAAGTYGNLFQAFGIAQPKAQEMSQTLVELAADLASFNNTSVEDAILALRSGLSGETEPLKRYGVAINEARLQTAALEAGIWDGTGALDAAQKAQASYILILKDTALAQGDVARSGDQLAIKQMRNAARLEDAMAQLGGFWSTVQLNILDAPGKIGDAVDLIAIHFGDMGDRANGLADRMGITFEELKTLVRTNMFETGGNVATALGDIEESFNETASVLPVSMQATMDSIADTVYGGAVPIEEEFKRLASVPTEALRDEYNAIRAAAYESMVAYAMGVMDGQNQPQVAFDAAMRLVEEELTETEEIARLKGQLITLELALGLAASEGKVASVNAINATIGLINARLDYLTDGAYQYGYNLASELARGMRAGKGLLVDPAHQLSNVIRGQVGIESEPSDPSSGLRGITHWGRNIVGTLADGIYDSLGTAQNAAGRLASSLAPSFGTSGFAASGAGSGGGGGDTYLQLVVDGKPKTVGSANEMWSGFEQLGRFGEPGR